MLGYGYEHEGYIHRGRRELVKSVSRNTSRLIRCIINPSYVEGVEGVEECQGESEGVEDSRGCVEDASMMRQGHRACVECIDAFIASST